MLKLIDLTKSEELSDKIADTFEGEELFTCYGALVIHMVDVVGELGVSREDFIKSMSEVWDLSKEINER